MVFKICLLTFIFFPLHSSADALSHKKYYNVLFASAQDRQVTVYMIEERLRVMQNRSQAMQKMIDDQAPSCIKAEHEKVLDDMKLLQDVLQKIKE